MSTNVILLIAFTMYIIGMDMAYRYSRFYMTFCALLWLIPVFLVDNTFIVLFSVIMFLIHIVIPLTSKGDDNFD